MKSPLRIHTMLFAMLISLAGVNASASESPFDSELQQLQKQWASIQYDTKTDQQADAFEALENRADQFVRQYQDRAEAHIWHGIILSTWAGAKGGLGALGLVKDARRELETALDLDASALNGSAYTSLGSLYYQVPGWPIAFGNDKQAKKYLQQALAINPNGIDPNYFYGDFLLEQGDYEGAKRHLTKVLQAEARPGRTIADAGRKVEAELKLKEVERHI